MIRERSDEISRGERSRRRGNLAKGKLGKVSFFFFALVVAKLMPLWGTAGQREVATKAGKTELGRVARSKGGRGVVKWVSYGAQSEILSSFVQIDAN